MTKGVEVSCLNCVHSLAFQKVKPEETLTFGFKCMSGDAYYSQAHYITCFRGSGDKVANDCSKYSFTTKPLTLPHLRVMLPDHFNAMDDYQIRRLYDHPKREMLLGSSVEDDFLRIVEPRIAAMRQARTDKILEDLKSRLAQEDAEALKAIPGWGSWL